MVDETSPRGVRWVGQDPGYDFEKLYAEEYKPYWRPGLTMSQVIARRVDTRTAAPWGGMTWLEDLKDSRTAPPPWWDAKARQKTLIGHPGKREGQWNGGHGFGQGIPGKTEFPKRWSENDIDLILSEAWENPTAVRYDGDRRYARRVIDGVLVEVSAYGKDHENFRAYFPAGGRGLIYNQAGGERLQKRIPRNAEKWELRS